MMFFSEWPRLSKAEARRRFNEAIDHAANEAFHDNISAIELSAIFEHASDTWKARWSTVKAAQAANPD